MDIEVEVRSFITKEQYDRLLAFFMKHAEHKGVDEQETRYFDTKSDVRLQLNQHHTKLWMKEGKMHDEQRREVELKLPKEDFEKVQAIFDALGHKLKVKWFRKRHTFVWGEIAVMVDYNKGYGFIVELEKMSTDAQKGVTLTLLKEKMKELGIAITPKEEFDKAYTHYVQNWETLTK